MCRPCGVCKQIKAWRTEGKRQAANALLSEHTHDLWLAGIGWKDHDMTEAASITLRGRVHVEPPGDYRLTPQEWEVMAGDRLPADETLRRAVEHLATLLDKP